MDANKIHERNENTLKTGEWWAIPWWQEDQYYGNSQFRKDEVEEAFLMLRGIFDAKWLINQRDRVITEAKNWLKENGKKGITNNLLSSFKEELESALEPLEVYKACTRREFRSKHPLFNGFLRGGQCPFNYFVALGRDLRNVKDAKLIGNLPKRLKDANEFSGAHFELNMLAHLTRLRYSIKRDVLTGKGNNNSDFRIEKGSEVFFVELKNLEQSRTNKDISRFSDLFHPILTGIGKLLNDSNSIIQHPKLSENLKEKIIKNEISYISIKKIAQQVWHDVTIKIKNKDWGHHTIEGIAEYDLLQREGEAIGDTDGFLKLPFSMEKEAEKICQVIDKYKDQLPVNEPGIFIIGSSFPLNCVEPALSTCEDWKRYQHVSAIVLVYTYFSSKGICHELLLIQNPNAALNIDNYIVMEDILRLADH